MKRYFLVITSGVFLFFILIFVQEYETFILPLLGASRKIDYKRLGDRCIETVKEFNKLFSDAYTKTDLKLIENLPAVESLKSEYVNDINFYKKYGITPDFSLKKTELLDLMFFSEKAGSLSQKEVWKMKLDKETQEVIIIVNYTLTIDGMNCIIGDLKIEEAIS